MALLLTLGNVARAEKWSDSWLDHCAAQFSSIDETNKVINITSEGELALWVAKADKHVNGSNATYAGWTINLTKDLDMTGHNWEPLWRFAGVFDGHDYTISNLYVEKHPEHYEQDVYVGFFQSTMWSWVDTHDTDKGKNIGTVKNLKIASSTFKGGTCVGAIVARPNGIIENCYVGSDVLVQSEMDITWYDGTRMFVGAGGIAGETVYDNYVGEIRGCISLAQVEGGYHAGGLVGVNHHSVIDCLYMGNHVVKSTVYNSGSRGWTAGEDGGSNLHRTFFTDQSLSPLNSTDKKAIIYDLGRAKNKGNLVKDYGMMKGYEKGVEYNGKFYTDDPLVQLAYDGEHYLISDADDWRVLASLVALGYDFDGKLLKQTSDIFVDQCVGTSEHPFKGTYLGEHHWMNTSIQKSSQDFVAPFSYVDGATIQDLYLFGGNSAFESTVGIIGGCHSAGLVGKVLGTADSKETLISNCWVSTKVLCGPSNNGTDKDHGGGIVAHAGTSKLRIEGCVFDGNIEITSEDGTNAYFGYIVGWAEDFSTLAQRVHIENCVENVGFVDARLKNQAMGFCYRGVGDIPTFGGATCYSVNQLAGGTAVYPVNFYGPVNYEFVATETNHYTYYQEEGLRKYLNFYGDGSFVIPDKEGNDLHFGCVGNQIQFKATSASKQLQINEVLFNNQVITPDDEGIYKITVVAGTNEVKCNMSRTKWTTKGLYAEEFASKDEGTNTITIETPAQLALLAWQCKDDEFTNPYKDWTIRLKADLNMSEYLWDPIREFCGIFDGEGHTIYDVNTEDTSADHVGLFGTNQGTVKNVKMSSNTFCRLKGDENVGAVVGWNGGTVTGCYVDSKVHVSGKANVGGVVGRVEDVEEGTVNGCVSAALVSDLDAETASDYVGGVVGKLEKGSMYDCIYIGTSVESKGQHRGAYLGGKNDAGTSLSNCYYTQKELQSKNLDGVLAYTIKPSDNSFSIELADEVGNYDKVGLVTYQPGQAFKWDGGLYAPITSTSNEVKLKIVLKDAACTVTAVSAEGLDYSLRRANEYYYLLVNGDMVVTIEYSVPTVELQDNWSTPGNGTLLEQNDGKERNVKLSSRALYRDGSWNTLCLPFDVTLAGSPLEGADARTLQSSSFAEGTLTVTFGDAVTTLTAGVPYIVRWPDAGNDLSQLIIDSPEFERVVIKNQSHPVGTDYVKFVGSFSPSIIHKGDKTRFYLGAGDQLYWAESDVTICSCRAYFELLGGLTLDGVNASAIQLNFDGEGETTGISPSPALPQGEGAWYSLDGRKLQGTPTAKGIYIKNGKKIVIK